MAILYTDKHRIPFLVDDQDVTLVSQYTWYQGVCNWIVTNAIDETRALHKLLMGPAPEGKRWAFLNKNTTDCRRDNLILVDRKKKRRMGIYAIKNLQNGKMFIGGSTDIENRWSTHLWKLTNIVHHNDFLQYDWMNLGRDQFQLVVLVEVTEPQMVTPELEQLYIDTNDCYNQRPAGNKPGFVLSRESAEKIANSNRGQVRTGQALENIRAGGMKQRGRIVSEDTKRKQSESAKNRRRK
jgi:group I intron endonuclease